MNIELKECPFCGKTPALEQASIECGVNQYWVRCTTLDCVEQCFMKSAEKAAEAWNNRAAKTLQSQDQAQDS